jgi:hypothetical protein
VRVTCAAFQAFNQDTDNILVLGRDRNLCWSILLNGRSGQVPPPREQVDGNVLAFQAIDLNNVIVLGTDNILWVEHVPFGQVPPPRGQFTLLKVLAFQAVDTATIAFLDTDQNLWLQAGFTRAQVDGNVEAFNYLMQIIFTFSAQTGIYGWSTHLLATWFPQPANTLMAMSQLSKWMRIRFTFLVQMGICGWSTVARLTENSARFRHHANTWMAM